MQIETFPIASVEDVYAVYDSSAKELDENLKIEYIEEVINIVVHIATTINIHASIIFMIYDFCFQPNINDIQLNCNKPQIVF